MNSKKNKLIREIVKEINQDVLFLEEDFDDALIGTGKTYGFNNSVAVYSSDLCILILIKKYNMSELEAFEHFSESIENLPMDNNKPIFISDFRKIKEIKINQENICEENYLSDVIKRFKGF